MKKNKVKKSKNLLRKVLTRQNLKLTVDILIKKIFLKNISSKFQ